MVNKVTSMGFAFLLLSAQALALPIGSRMDQKVRTFIASTPLEGEESTLPVLVQYQNPIVDTQSFMGPNWRKQTVTYLQQTNQRVEANVFANVSAPLLIENLWIVHGSYAQLTASEIKVISQNPLVEAIHSLDRSVHLIPLASKKPPVPKPNATYGLEKMRVPELNALEPDRDGRGVRVGILDTGIAASHPALSGKLLLFKDFISQKKTAPYDDHGHGTHVAGTIAGSPVSGVSIGVAPGASLIIGKVFSQYGSSSEKGLLDSMQWMADPDGNPATDDAPHIVSNSWTADSASSFSDPAQEPFCAAVDTWVKLGIVPVFAAGNSGPSSRTIGVPAECPAAVAVAATDSDDRIATFSSRGPARWKSVVVGKPNVAAPGVDVESADNNGGTVTMSGTSMACPHVAGAMAVLLQGASRADSANAIQALYSGAQDLGASGADYQFGVGRVDLVRSMQILK